MRIIKVKYQQEGHCANCNLNDIEFNAQTEYGDDQITYPYTCPKCKHIGSETYNLDYAGSQ